MDKSEYRLQTRCRWLLTTGLAACMLHVSSVSAQDAPEDAASRYDHGLELYVSEDALQALYQRNMDLGDLGASQVGLGFFLNEERDLVGMLDALLPLQLPARSRWSIQAGPRMYAALMNVEDTDLFAVGFGGEIKYALTTDRRTNVSLGGFYGPSILTFGEADNMRDVHLRLEAPLADGIQIFVGYRLFEWDMTIGPTEDPLAAETRKIDDGVQLGLRATF